MGVALVTGASAGLGLEFCWQLAARRHNLVLVARDQERLEKLAADLWQIAQVRSEVLVADLSTDEGIARVCSRLRQNQHPVGLLVNNAGYGMGKPFLDSELAAQDQALQVMVRAVMNTSYTAANAMRERGRGAILNVSSIAADTGMGSYSAHKAWVRAFTEGLALELRGSGVSATVLLPGLMHTEFHVRSGRKVRAPEWTWLDAASVADQALDAVARGQVSCTPGLVYKAAATALRTLPRTPLRAIVSRLPHT